MEKICSTSERLQQALQEKGMRQAELARLTGIPRGAVSNYVLGRYEPKLEIIKKFSQALGYPEMWERAGVTMETLDSMMDEAVIEDDGF